MVSFRILLMSRPTTYFGCFRTTFSFLKVSDIPTNKVNMEIWHECSKTVTYAAAMAGMPLGTMNCE